MSNYTDAAEVLERELKRYDSFIVAAKALREVGALEQAANAARANEAASHAHVVSLKDEIADLGMQAQDAKGLLDDLVAKNKAAAAKVIDDANSKADEIVRVALEQAAKVRGDAPATSNGQISALTGQVTALATDKARAEAELEQLNKDKARVVREAKDAAELLARIKAQIKAMAA